MREPWIIAVLLAAAAPAAAVENLTSGPAIDYQPAVIRSSDDGARVVVFERLDPSTFSGDLWLTRSSDDGATWSTPTAIIASGANERHPALVQNGPADYALFYLKGVGSSYRLWRATSTDGISFSEQAQLDLGWAQSGEINPHVIRHADGTLTMSYQRLSGGSYLAQSSDGGASWDMQKTLIAAGSQLPRIAYRESDGLYLASYQVGSSALKLYVKTSPDLRDWSAAAQDFAITGNNHDSLPVVMPDGAFALFWIRQNGNGFDLAVRRSVDAVNWEPALAITTTPNEDDVEPHPLVGSSATHVELYWGRDLPAGSMQHDIVREPALRIIADQIFEDAFEGG
ncbi:sialidase family protein [Dokdonella sp.]|uniref:sialidase family protein n=1 Tax=Dokdonella sp. TaxID=2291710 RepID=UPI0025C5F8D4|nr:sialidase family protein [Dokdonella sp.]MBX3688758.1 exo-alpha-sialidase [Dokdonella sp.]